MKVTNYIFILFFIILTGSSCGLSFQRLHDQAMANLDKIHSEAVAKYNEDKKIFDQEVKAFFKKDEEWKQKEISFLNSLSNEELQAYSELKEAYKQGEAKYLLTYRKFLALLNKTENPNKFIIYKKICRETNEILKQYDMLVAKEQELEKRRKKLLAIEKQRQEEQESRRHEQAVASIRSIGSAIDNYRQQQWLQQQQMLHQQQWNQQQQWMQQQQRLW